MTLATHLATAFCELKRLDFNNMQPPVINVVIMHRISKMIADVTCTLPWFPKSLKYAFVFAFFPSAVFLVPKAIASQTCMQLPLRCCKFATCYYSLYLAGTLHAHFLGRHEPLLLCDPSAHALCVSLMLSCRNSCVVVLLVSSLAASSCLQERWLGGPQQQLQ